MGDIYFADPLYHRKSAFASAADHVRLPSARSVRLQKYHGFYGNAMLAYFFQFRDFRIELA